MQRVGCDSSTIEIFQSADTEMYRLSDVDRSYGQCAVIRNATCSIPTDRLVAVMGPSGSGKSTLLRLLSFLEKPNRGAVTLNLHGDEFDSRLRARPWPRVTCVFQQQFLWPHLTLRENLILPLRAGGHEEIDARVAHAVDLFGMSDFIGRYPNEVSGGQAQRVALARAFVLEPEIVLIDEPHSGLDLRQQSVLNRHLLALRQAGTGLIVVTHSMDFARQYAEDFVLLEEGIVTVSSSRKFWDLDSDYVRQVGRTSEGRRR